MNYGFVIDTRSCIGCHACTTACKSENQVPLGVNRTWVKVTETGRYPDVRRSFQVTRCNHCANPPCVRICPVSAMVQRSDGIVEFDGDLCIGCKACLQACPYDAIYVDPDTGTAAKCHFCAHRVENGIEPACVVVCPTHAILAGDLDDPRSEVARAVARHDVTVRRPEQGTAPKLFYIQGHDVSLHPTALDRSPRLTAFADVLDPHGRPAGPAYGDAADYVLPGPAPGARSPVPSSASAGTSSPFRAPGTQGLPGPGPVHVAPGIQAGHRVQQVAYTAWHRVPWHWPVPAYLVTKALGAGIFLLLAAATLAGRGAPARAGAVAGGIGILALLATTALLVADLERPERFLRVLTRPQRRSWLARGAFILVAFTNLAALWWLVTAARALGWIGAPGALDTVLAGLVVPLGIGSAVYTAFLFAQCEGRDLWQSPLLPFHLLVQALAAGAAGLALAAALADTPDLAALARGTLASALLVDGFATLSGEFGVAHASEAAARAAHAITRGRFARVFWGGAMVLGHAVPLALLAVSAAPAAVATAGVLALAGLYAYEHAFVLAPQEIPNS